MAKDPAFLFYVTDFNDGTQDFTNEEVGAYLRILLFQFSQGHLPLDRIKRKLGSDFDRIWPTLQMKFKQDEHGLFYNLRLEEEQIKRKKYSESRKNNITKRYEKQVNNISSTYVQHMEDEDENENEDRNVNKNDSVIVLKKEESEIEKLSPEFIAYKDWAARNFPDLLKFDKPLTDKQLHALFDEFKDKTLVREKLEALGNKRKAKTDYKTVYATCRNWCKRDLERGYVSKDTIQPGQDVWSRTSRILDKVAAERYGTNQQNQLT